MFAQQLWLKFSTPSMPLRSVKNALERPEKQKAILEKVSGSNALGWGGFCLFACELNYISEKIQKSFSAAQSRVTVHEGRNTFLMHNMLEDCSSALTVGRVLHQLPEQQFNTQSSQL